MTQSSAARTLVAGSLLLVVTGAGCGSGEVPHGAPVLLKVYWQVIGGNAKACATIDHDASPVAAEPDDAADAADAADAQARVVTMPSNQCLVWSNDPGDAVNPDVKTVVPAAPYEFNLVFDRVLDGSKVEDTITDGGFTLQAHKTFCPLDGGPCDNPAPVTVSWPGLDPVTPQQGFNLAVWYNSVPLPIAPAASSYVFGRELPSYPSDTEITIILDRTRLTSRYNEPMTGPTEIKVRTAPFSLSIDLPQPPAGQTDSHPPTSFWVPLQFTNLLVKPSDVLSTALGPHVHVQQNGRTLDASEYQLVTDPVDATLVFIRPVNVAPSAAAADGGVATNPIWDSGARIDVTVDGDLTDVFGAKLASAVSVSFVACETQGAPGPGSCAPPTGTGTLPTPDAGAGDASDVGDGGVDAPVDAPAGDDDAAATD